MTTSGSYDFNLNTNEIINAALRKIRAIPYGQTADEFQIKYGRQALNSMIKNWRARDAFIFDLDWTTIDLQASTVVVGSDGYDYECIRNHESSSDDQPITGANYLSYWKKLSTTGEGVAWSSGQDYVSSVNYDLDTNIVGISDMFIRDENNYDVSMTPITKKEYFQQGNKTSEGKPTMYYFRRKPTPQIYIYPLPDDETKYVLNLDVFKYPDDFDSGTNTPDYLQEWLDPLIFNLAVRLHPEFGTLPTGEFDRLRLDAENLFDIASGLDEETGDAYFQPDMRR